MAAARYRHSPQVDRGRLCQEDLLARYEVGRFPEYGRAQLVGRVELVDDGERLAEILAHLRRRVVWQLLPGGHGYACPPVLIGSVCPYGMKPRPGTHWPCSG
jgi:hypothetical protein